MVPAAAAGTPGEVTRVAEHVPLAPFTTLGLGGPARRFAEAETSAALVSEAKAADARGEPLLVLGGGSNLVIADEGFPGTVVRIASRGVRLSRARVAADEDAVDVTVAAGEDWDEVVASCVAEGLSGLECLSGIPGVAGATPIQNVSAYGQEVSQSLTEVRAYDRRRRSVVNLAPADCRFGYRDSMFKRRDGVPPGAGLPFPQATGRFVVLGVTFRLTRSARSQPVRYRELAVTLGIAEGDRAPLADVRAAVLALRRAKGMVLDPRDPDSRSAGSFFTNPVLSRARFAALERFVAGTWGEEVRVPHFAADDGEVKVPAAWLIERAGFGRGYPGAGIAATGPRVSGKHTLALVNPGGATTAGLLRLATEIRDGVRGTFGVDLACEPVLVGTGLTGPVTPSPA